MKVAILLVIGVCYFHLISAQGDMNDTAVAMNMTDYSGSGDDDNTTSTEVTDMTATVDMITTTSNDTDGDPDAGQQQSGLSTGGIVGVVVGVVAFVVLVTLLVTIIVILSIKSKKAKVALQVSPTQKQIDSKVTSHGKSVAMKELPVVDSS